MVSTNIIVIHPNSLFSPFPYPCHSLFFNRIHLWSPPGIISSPGSFAFQFGDHLQTHTKDVHCLCLIKNCINMLLWQQNLRVFWAGYTHLGRVLCLILGRIRTCHTLKNINTFCCVGWWDWGYNILSYVWPQGYFKIKITESYM